MGNTTSNDALRMSQWATICESARSHALLMARMHRGVAAQMMRRETDNLCSQRPPTTDAELSHRLIQASALTSKIGSIAHADSMARMHPRVADQIFEETKRFCDRVSLDGDVFNESFALNAKISSICHGDLVEQLR